MKIRIFLKSAAYALVVGSILLNGMGCPGERGPAPKSEVKFAEVNNCNEHDGKESDCNNAKEKASGKRCFYSNDKCLVIPEGPVTGKCADLLEKAKCDKRIDCEMDSNDKCVEKAAACPNVKDEDSCKITYASLCDWTPAGACIAKSTTPPNVDIFTWTKAPLPAGSLPAELTHFVVSGDNNHAYAFTTDAANGNANRGLYHTSDRGVIWTRFESAVGANDGIVRGKVDPGAADSDWDSSAGGPVDLKPTQLGAVVSTTDGIWLLEGNTVKWGILNAVNDIGAAVGAPTTVANFQAQDIQFIDVVDVNGVETIAFGQVDDATTQYHLWLQRTANNTAPLRIKIIKAGGGGNLTDSQLWTRAGNTHDGDLILASVVGNATGPGTGLWHVPKANLPAAAAGPLPADVGKVAFDAPVLFPENNRDWRGNAGSSNINIKLVGSASTNVPGAHLYFAGMAEGAGGTELGGIATHTNSQSAAGAHAAFTTFGFDKISIFRITPKGLATSHGIRAANKANDYLVSSFAPNKNHMMAGTNAAVPFGPQHDHLLRDLFGDDNLMWYWFTGADPQAGIFVRVKSQGQPRP